MYFLEEFYVKTIKLNLVNKFIYNKSKKLCKLKKISFSFNCNKIADIKYISSGILALEWVTKQKGVMIFTKKSNIKFKLKKGYPMGCKVVLRKINIFYMCFKLFIKILQKNKIVYILKSNKIIPKNLFVGRIKDPFDFEELIRHYYLFNSLFNLNFIISTNSTRKEYFFILKSFKFPFKIENLECKL